MLTVKDIVKYRKDRNLTQQAMADLAGIARELLNKIENGKLPITRTTSMIFEKLISENEPHSTASESLKSETSTRADKLVPVLDIEFTAGFVQQIRDKQPEILTYTNMPEVQGCDYIIRAKGDSMADYINNMDWIGIKAIHDKEVISYGNAYAIVTKDLQLIKYIRKGSKGNYLLSSRNKDYDDFELPITKVLDLFIIKTVLKIKTII